MRFENYVSLIFVTFTYYSLYSVIAHNLAGTAGLLFVLITIEIGCLLGVYMKRRRDSIWKRW